MLNFHPERLCARGQSVSEGLLQDGIYKSQFETGLSSGSPTAFLDGERDLWEKRLGLELEELTKLATDEPTST